MNIHFVAVLKLNEKEIETFVDAFNNTNATRERGIFFNNRNYTCLRADEQSIYAKDVTIFRIVYLGPMIINFDTKLKRA